MGREKRSSISALSFFPKRFTRLFSPHIFAQRSQKSMHRTGLFRFINSALKEIAFYLSAIGSTGTSEYCIESNWLTGAEKFIMFGSAGSLDKEKTQVRFVIPTEAYRDEGISYHYAPPTDYIKMKNHEKLAAIFDELHFPYVKGRVWTTDAFLRETAGQVAKRQEEGCIAVDMELAGVQSVCDFYGFDLYDFLVTGDVLSEDKYEMERFNDANHNLDKFYIALEIAKRI